MKYYCSKCGLRIPESDTLVNQYHNRTHAKCGSKVYPEPMDFMKSLRIDFESKRKTEPWFCRICSHFSICSILMKQTAKENGCCSDFIINYKLVDSHELRRFESMIINELMERDR